LQHPPGGLTAAGIFSFLDAVGIDGWGPSMARLAKNGQGR